MHSPNRPHGNSEVDLEVHQKTRQGKVLFYVWVGYLNVDWAGLVDGRCSTSAYCTSVGDNLITRKTKKQTVVTHYSAEAESSGMANTTYELIWLKQLVEE